MDKHFGVSYSCGLCLTLRHLEKKTLNYNYGTHASHWVNTISNWCKVCKSFQHNLLLLLCDSSICQL